MKKIFSILHISDLHKDKSADYKYLLSSLESDRSKWKTEGIPMPEFIVVSGDLVQGVKDYKCSKNEADVELSRQYDETAEFLIEIANKFLSGKRERIIIVPGNHDVNRNASYRSMDELDMDRNIEIAKSLSNSGWDSEIYRWSWETCCFSQIVRPDAYGERFDAYKQFVESFYQGCRNLNDCEKEALIEDFPSYNVTFVGYNSCCGIDHLNAIGRISNDALHYRHQDLQDYYDHGRLIIGVWHHHVYGSPYSPNFMDKGVLPHIHENHVKLALFGHQHYAEVADEYVNFESKLNDSDESLLLISSGTLFGTKKQMQPGIRRQYNIIEVQMDNGCANLRIHTREDKLGDTPYPIWKKHVVQPNNYIEHAVYLKRVNSLEKAYEIDKLTREKGNFKEGISLLLADMPAEDDNQGVELYNSLINTYLQQLNLTIDFQFIIQTFSSPNNSLQRGYLLQALINDKQYDRANALAETIKEPLPIEQQAIDKLKSIMRWHR